MSFNRKSHGEAVESYFDYQAQLITTVVNSFYFIKDALKNGDLNRAQDMSDKYSFYLDQLLEFHQECRAGTATALYDNPKKLKEIYSRIRK